MDDFFDGLRNGKNEKQRISKPRKIHNSNYQYKKRSFHFNNNQRPPMQKQNGNRMPVAETSSLLLQDAVENLCSFTEILTRNHEYLIDSHKKTVDMIERQVAATEKILDHLSI